MDLFQPLVNEDRLHPLFKAIALEATHKPTMKVINHWSKGLLDRKKEAIKFVKEFQTTFNSSLWEIYLNKAFLDLDFIIDYTKESPDFHLKHSSGRLVNVEAVTSNNKLNESEEYYNSMSFTESIEVDRKEFLDRSTIKLAGKIKDKLDLFLCEGGKKYPYSSLEHVKNNPFVLAVAPFDNHLSFLQNNMAINRVLYGIEPPNGANLVEKISSILNHNNNKIDLGIFTNPSHKEISAVIFSTTGTFGKAVVEAGVSNIIRATRYRQLGIDEFKKKEGVNKLGMSHTQVSDGHDVFSMRILAGDQVYGSDMFLYNSSNHIESHLDGLHVYYNPYAEIPLDKDLFSAYEITQNEYDIKTQEMVCKHNDGSLVSRQTFTQFA